MIEPDTNATEQEKDLGPPAGLETKAPPPRIVSADERTDIGRLQVQIQQQYSQLGVLEAQRREIVKALDTTADSASELQRDLAKTTNRIFARFGIPPLAPGEAPKYAISTATGEIVPIASIQG